MRLSQGKHTGILNELKIILNENDIDTIYRRLYDMIKHPNIEYEDISLDSSYFLDKKLDYLEILIYKEDRISHLTKEVQEVIKHDKFDLDNIPNTSYNSICLYLTIDEALELFNKLYLLLNEPSKREIKLEGADVFGNLTKKLEIVKA